MPQSYTCLHYHFVFSTKNRVPLITPEWEERLWGYLGGIVRDLGGMPLQIGGVDDHVHLLVTLGQEHRPMDVMREVKAGSSSWVHAEFPDVREFRWQTGYGAFSVSHSNVGMVKAYITNQREHHAEQQMSYTDELRRTLKKHGVRFEEKYLE